MNFIDYLIATKNYSTLNVVNEYSKQFALNQTSINALKFRQNRIGNALNPGNVGKNIKLDDINRHMMERNEYHTHNPNDVLGYGNTARELDNNRRQLIEEKQQYRQNRAQELWNNRKNWYHRNGSSGEDYNGQDWSTGKKQAYNAAYPGDQIGYDFKNMR